MPVSPFIVRRGGLGPARVWVLLGIKKGKESEADAAGDGGGCFVIIIKRVGGGSPHFL